MAEPAEEKPVKCIVLDAGPLILNEPSISSLLAKSEQLYTTQAVLAEIKDATARARVQTTVMPFLNVREPSPASIGVVADFARRTGDLPVLSKTDLQVIALAYELECERNGGDWRLRKLPGQKAGEKSRRPVGEAKGELGETGGSDEAMHADEKASRGEGGALEDGTGKDGDLVGQTSVFNEPKEGAIVDDEQQPHEQETIEAPIETVTKSIALLGVNESGQETTGSAQNSVGPKEPQTDIGDEATTVEAPEVFPEEQSTTLENTENDHSGDEDEDEDEDADAATSDSDGEWITAGNLKQHQAAATASGSPSTSKKPTVDPPIQVGTLTTDFALQNVLLQMDLHLLSARGLTRIRQIRGHALRCHACFAVSRQLERQFCARCGQPTLTRVSCTTTAGGQGLRIHLSKNFHLNRRGDKFSIPKPVAGTSSGRNVRGAGKGQWGHGLILAEDQKEYQRATAAAGRKNKSKSSAGLDEDYLPGILTGRRDGGGGGGGGYYGGGGPGGGRPKVGAGRNVNSKKRR